MKPKSEKTLNLKTPRPRGFLGERDLERLLATLQAWENLRVLRIFRDVLSVSEKKELARETIQLLRYAGASNETIKSVKKTLKILIGDVGIQMRKYETRGG